MNENQMVPASQMISKKCSEIGIILEDLKKMCLTMNKSPEKILKLVESYEKNKKK